MFDTGAIAAGAFAGACCGSIASAMSWRLPRDISLWQRSTCDSCGAVLGVVDLAPILSWVIFGGRCRRCGKPIGKRYLALEVAGAGMLACAAAILGVGPALAALTVILVFALTICMTDLEGKTIHLGPILLMAVAGMGWHQFVLGSWWPSLLGMAAVGGFFAVLAIAFWVITGRAGMGGGDVGLAAGAGAWLGWAQVGGPAGVPAVVLFPMAVGFSQVAVALGWRMLYRDHQAPMAPGMMVTLIILSTVAAQ